MLPIELLALIFLLVVLVYLAFFSPKFDRFCRKIFRMNNGDADRIAEQAAEAEAAKAATLAAKQVREKQLADEQAKLNKIQVK